MIAIINKYAGTALRVRLGPITSCALSDKPRVSYIFNRP